MCVETARFKDVLYILYICIYTVYIYIQNNIFMLKTRYTYKKYRINLFQDTFFAKTSLNLTQFNFLRMIRYFSWKKLAKKNCISYFEGAAPCFLDDSDLNVWSWFAHVNSYLGLLAFHDTIRSIGVGHWYPNWTHLVPFPTQTSTSSLILVCVVC